MNRPNIAADALDAYMKWYVDKYEIKSESDIRSEPHIPLYKAWQESQQPTEQPND